MPGNDCHYPIPLIPTNAWQRLPEDEDDLITAARNYYGCTSILATAGSQAALQILPKLRAPSKIAMPITMYQEHAHTWQTQGHTVHFFKESPDAEALKQADVILVCNPNNPTGKRFTKMELLEWHQQLAARGAWLIVDEAFMDSTPDDSLAAHADLEGLFILRSLGKFFGLAGVRVGFLLAADHYLVRVKEMIGPWSVTGPSRYIATQALQDTEWQLNTREMLASQSAKMQNLLNRYNLKPQGSTDLFHYVPTANANEIQAQLAQLGIWIRIFSNPSALRFGLPPAHQWDRLEAALSTLIAP
jgi:cobalamin biosynthesis protein CobC